jgi:hypothetical protein
MANVGSNKFDEVACPLVFENRYFLVDQSVEDPKWTVLSLKDGDLIIEVLNNQPQKNKITEVETNPTGIITVSDQKSDKFLYKIRPDSRSTSIFGSIRGEVTEIRITDKEIRVGTNVFRRNSVKNSPIGVLVHNDGAVSLGGGRLPKEIEIYLASNRDEKAQRFKENFQGQTWKNVRLTVDNNSYDNCTFIKCELIYSGGKPPSITNCTFDSHSWTFSSQAQNTLIFLKNLFHGGFEKDIEKTFDNIRKAE